MSERRRERPKRRHDVIPVSVNASAELRAHAAAVRAAERRFEAAVEVDAAAGGADVDAEVLRRLRDEPITGMGRVVYSSNAVFLLQMEGADPTHPAEPLRAIYKPARGERPLWDFPPRTLHLREVAAYLVSAALTDGLVPATTLRDGPHGPGSVQLFIHAAESAGLVPPAAVEEHLRALAALDVLINNADRKSAHLLLGDDGRLRGIDNALSFLPYPRQRTVLIDLGGQALPAAVSARVAALAGDAARRAELGTALGRLLDADEVAAFGERLDDLAAAATYPVLDPWDGRPFEWW